MSIINKRAKKYESLRQKQALANKYIKQQRTELGESHRFVKSAMERIKTFQNKHDLPNSKRLGMKHLKEEDVESYNQLLDSIIDSTYMNPIRYQEFKESQLEYAVAQGWADDRDEAELIYEFANSDIVDDLKDKASIDIPSKIVEKYAKYMAGRLTKEDFTNMVESFMKRYSSGDLKTGDFFNYADVYKDLSEVASTEKNYGISSTADDIIDEMINDRLLVNMGSNDFNKAIKEYKEQEQYDNEGNLLTFVEYFKRYYL